MNGNAFANALWGIMFFTLLVVCIYQEVIQGG